MSDISKTIIEDSKFLPGGSDKKWRYPEWPESEDGSTWFVAHRSSLGVFWLALSRGSDKIWRSGYYDHKSGCEWKSITEQKPGDFWTYKNIGLREEACILAEMEMLSMARRRTIGNTINRLTLDTNHAVLVSTCAPSIIKHSFKNRTEILPCFTQAWRTLGGKLALGADTSLVRLGAVSSLHSQLVILMLDHDGDRQVHDWQILNLNTGALTTMFHTGNSDHPLSLSFNLMSVAQTNAYTGGASSIPEDLHQHVERLVRTCVGVKDSVEMGMKERSDENDRPDMSVLHLLLSSPPGPNV